MQNKAEKEFIFSLYFAPRERERREGGFKKLKLIRKRIRLEKNKKIPLTLNNNPFQITRRNDIHQSFLLRFPPFFRRVVNN